MLVESIHLWFTHTPLNLCQSVQTPGNNVLLCQAMNGPVQLGRDLHPSPSPHVRNNRGATALLVGQE
jgi:hypothetical protein